MDLPIAKYRSAIVASLRSSPVTIVYGETGCGKTTQVPQYALDGGVGGRIVVAQPRRIAAIAMARRVAAERGARVGTDVGFAVRFERCCAEDAPLRFVTDGVLLREALERGGFGRYALVMVDEAHERSLTTDILLALLRRELRAGQPLKVVISSATMDAGQFSRFFDDAPVITVPGTCFPVRVRYRPVAWGESETASGAHAAGGGGTGAHSAGGGGAGASGDAGSGSGAGNAGRRGTDGPRANGAASGAAVAAAAAGAASDAAFPRRRRPPPLVSPRALVAAAVSAALRIHLDDAAAATPPLGHILVFLPGRGDCEFACERALSDLRALAAETAVADAVVLPLYGTLPQEKQALVFERVGPRCRKIVFCTNVAETSVTVDDVQFVVDCGFVKEKWSAPKTGFEVLKVVRVSKSQAIQRAGRAGRVRPGVCYRLYDREQFDNLRDMAILEIERVQLSSVVLLLKAMGLVNILAVKFLDPPKPEAVLAALQALYLLGAVDDEGRVTDVGKMLVGLPVDPLFGRNILEGLALGVCDEVVDITALCSTEQVWARNWRQSTGPVPPHSGPDPPDDSLTGAASAEPDNGANQTFTRPSGGSTRIFERFGDERSDHITLLNVLDAFRREHAQDRMHWCHERGVSYKALSTAAEIAEQLRELVRGGAGEDRGGSGPVRGSKAWRHAVLKALCAGGFLRAARLSNYSVGLQDLGEAEAEPEPAYVTLRQGAIVRCDASSAVHRSNARAGIVPEYVIYNEVFSLGGDARSAGAMRVVSAVREEWLRGSMQRFRELSVRKLAATGAEKAPERLQPLARTVLALPRAAPAEAAARERAEKAAEREAVIDSARERYLARKRQRQEAGT